MRAERLYTIVSDISKDLETSDVIERVSELSDALNDLSRSPTEENEEAVSEARAAVDLAINASSVRKYPPAFWSIIEQMKIDHLYGDKLIARIDGNLQGSGITPIVARDAINKTLEKLQGLKAQADAAIEALGYFEIEPDELSPGSFEMMVQIPGRAIHDELGQFGKEAQRLNSILAVFTEIATGSREPIKLRAIGSSDPTLFLDSLPATAALVATSIERIAAFYSQVQGIIKTHRDMKAQNVPASVVEGMKKHIDESIKNGLDEIAKTIEKQNMKNVPTERRPEIKSELKMSLYELARRIDEGYVFDVRGAAPADDVADEAPVADRAKVEQAFRIVEEVRPRIQHFEAEAEPILSLPRPEEQ